MPEETVSPLTSAECLAIAERKIVEAMSSRRHGKELKLTAQAWMVLADKVRQDEALRKQAEALEVARVAPDLASQLARLKIYCRRHPGFPALSSCKLPLKTSPWGLAGLATRFRPSRWPREVV